MINNIGRPRRGSPICLITSGSKKKVNENTYDISSIKRVTKKFLKVSRCSRAKQRQRNVQKKCASPAMLPFFLIRPIAVLYGAPFVKKMI